MQFGTSGCYQQQHQNQAVHLREQTILSSVVNFVKSDSVHMVKKRKKKTGIPISIGASGTLIFLICESLAWRRRGLMNGRLRVLAR